MRFAFDDSGIYWLQQSAIVRVLPGEARLRRISLAASGQFAGANSRVAVDDKYVYWVDAGFIGRVPK